MKIFILAHQLRAGGGKVTCINLIRNLLEIDQQNTYLLIVPDDPDYRDLRLEDHVDMVRYYNGKFGYLGLVFFDVLTRHRLLRQFKPDLVWFMSGSGLYRPPCKQAVSIQNAHVMYKNKDLEWLTLKAKLRLAYLRFRFRSQLQKTDLVLFQTQTMKERCQEKYNYQGRALVTYKGLSSFLDSEKDIAPPELRPFRDHFKLFYLTRYYPHKGLETLVELMDQYRELLKDVVLVITIEGSQHPLARKLLAMIRHKGLEDRVINVGSLKQSQLADFYSGVDCLVMPSRLESFSGTYLEAMHYGVPIITSNLDFAREICGSAAVYVDPRNVRGIKDAVLQVKQDLQLRNEMIRKGQERLAEKFSMNWKEIAEDIKREFDRIH